MSNQAPLPTRIDLSDSPVDLATLDDLFPPDPVPASAQQKPADTPPAPAAQQPTVPAADQPYVQGSKSVYKTREAAVEGINQKDALIEQLRQTYALTTGVDPITKQPVGANQGPVASDNYVTNPRKYVADLRAATTDEQLANVQQKLIFDTIQPMAPAISGVTRAQASRQIEAEIPDFNTFYNSPDYQETLAKVPSIKEAIEMAEGDIRFHPRLPELYKTAYLVSRGMQLPDLLKRASAPNQPTGKPTATPTTPTPPEQGTSAAERTVRTKDGRKAIIAQFEETHKGVLPW